MDMSRIANLTLTSTCFLFISLLAIMYFSKKNMKNYENKIYKHILVWSIINLIFYLIGSIPYYTNPTLYNNDTFTIVTAKLTGCSTVVWFTYFALYIQIVAKENKKKKSFILNNKYAPIIIQILVIIIGLLAFVFQMGRMQDPNGDS